MADPIDLYSDQLGLNIGPFGAVLNFGVSPSVPPPGGGSPPLHHIATVRMSLEHAKITAFMLHRQLLQYERSSGIKVPLPQDVLNHLRVGREDWDGFWSAE